MIMSDGCRSARRNSRTRTALVVCWLAAGQAFGGLFGCRGEEARRIPDTEVVREPIVVVFNGSGVPGSARKVAEALRAGGFDVGNGYGENADSFEYPKTLVVDYVGRPGEAQKVADFLGAPMVQQISHDPDRFGTIGVIVGADYSLCLSHVTGE